LSLHVDRIDLKIADRELERSAEIERQLDYISRQLGQLDITKNLPNAEVPFQHLMNCAMEVRSAVMMYLSTVIRSESRSLGVIGIEREFHMLIRIREDYPFISER
jgi:hypothetical protein